jgi:hypothetical protein
MRVLACGDSDIDSMRCESPPDCCVSVDIVWQGRFSGGRRDWVTQLQNGVVQRQEEQEEAEEDRRHLLDERNQSGVRTWLIHAGR